MTLTDLTAAIDMLRARGVKSYVDVAGGGFTIEFFQPLPDTKAEPPPKGEEMCRCGHALYEHNAGLCIARGGGCDPTKCAPETK